MPVAVDGASKSTYAMTAYVSAAGVAGAPGPTNGNSLFWPPCVQVVPSAQDAAAFLQHTPYAIA